MADQFNPQNKTRYLFVTDIADRAAPTVAELTAGIDLSPGLMRDGVEGFQREQGTIDSTGITDSEETTEYDLASVTPGSLVMKRASTPGGPNADLFDEALALVGTVGFVVFVLDGQIDTGAFVSVHPSRVGLVSEMPYVGGQLARYTISFTHPAPSVINAVVAGP